IFAQAGVSSAKLLRFCEHVCKTGAEFLEGIPCTIGGALYMNAGVAGAYIGDIVRFVKVYYRGKVSILSVEDCKYAYKSSVFMQDDFLILGAKLSLLDATKTEILEKKATYKARRAHLPKGKSMGCVFKNPQGISAGKWIEGAGLKGLRIGGAKISEEHANFIINENNATTADVKQLISVIKNAVRIQYGVELQEEIRYLD
ncbi:MAG: UDP-N-acetylmuramate dehydrogenase, partial [Clostridia bacterium]|nr:UDP-N-acetylmuramate dehydrogenase [Clostridia bacterium]